MQKTEMILNEYCLLMIFEKLGPKDWIVIDQVCLTWRNIILRLWKRIERIKIDQSYSESFFFRSLYSIIGTINSKEIDQIMKKLSNVNNLSLINFTNHEKKSKNPCIISFNKYIYKINKKDNVDAAVENALCHLWSKNCLKELKLSEVDTKEVNLNIFTQSLEHLSLGDVEIDDLNNFKLKLYQLPNLKSFDFHSVYVDDEAEESQESVFLKFEHVSNTIEENLYLRSFYCFKNLRKLVIYDRMLILSGDVVHRLVSSCNQLEVVKLGCIEEFSDISWRILLTLPNLKCIYLDEVNGMRTLGLFRPAFRLTSLTLAYSGFRELNIKSLCPVLYFMPLLSKLKICFFDDEDTILFVVKNVLHLASSRGQRIILQYNKPDLKKQLFIRSNFQRPHDEVADGLNPDFIFGILDYPKRVDLELLVKSINGFNCMAQFENL